MTDLEAAEMAHWRAVNARVRKKNERLREMLQRALFVWDDYRIDDTEDMRALKQEIREELER